MHGGKSTGPKEPNTAKNAVKHGIYFKHLTPEEQAEYAGIELGHVEEELKLARIRLARALKAEADADGKAEIVEEIENQGGGEHIPISVKTKRAIDYRAIIDRLLGRIESLERTRKLLDTSSGDENAAIAGFQTVPYTDDE